MWCSCWCVRAPWLVLKCSSSTRKATARTTRASRSAAKPKPGWSPGRFRSRPATPSTAANWKTTSSASTARACLVTSRSPCAPWPVSLGPSPSSSGWWSSPLAPSPAVSATARARASLVRSSFRTATSSDALGTWPSTSPTANSVAWRTSPSRIPGSRATSTARPSAPRSS